MARELFLKNLEKHAAKQDPALPNCMGDLEATLSAGRSLPIQGTNVIRVPFGVRQSRRQRPQRPDRWATLVLPLQPDGSPTPPPQAA